MAFPIRLHRPEAARGSPAAAAIARLRNRNLVRQRTHWIESRGDGSRTSGGLQSKNQKTKINEGTVHRMANGGKRKGAGRPKGSKNKERTAIEAVIEKQRRQIESGVEIAK